MFLVLYGPDTYRSRQKLKEIVEEYRKKAGSELNLHRFDAEERDPTELKGFLEAQSLFAAKKLVVVEYALTQQAAFEILEPLLKNIADSRDTVVVLWDRELNEKSKKQLKKLGNLTNKIQEFKALSREQTRRWIGDEAKKRGVQLYPALLTQFDIPGSNLWALSNELDKMAVFPRTIEHRVFDSSWKGNVFHVGDTFFTSQRDGLRNTLHLLNQGHDDHNLFSYLCNHARTLLTVKSFLDRRQPVPSTFGIHPFVVKKASALVRSLSAHSLATTLHNFFEEDFKIKIGLTKPRESLMRLLYK
jgi:DNA polymerase III delta subunit